MVWDKDHATVDSTTLRVMCVDDEVSVLELLRIAVEDEPDFEIVAATDSADAVLNLCMYQRPDVVVLDHSLRPTRPGLGVNAAARSGQTGLELVEIVRSHLPTATIAIYTGHAGLDIASSRAGAQVYVEKPNFEALWPAIRSARAQ